jgi:hypothetical protein
VQNQETKPFLRNRYTNWETFQHFINEKLSLKVPLKKIEAAVKYFNDTMQWAG